MSFGITIKRYPVNGDGSRGTPETILTVTDTIPPYNDTLIDEPGEGTWIYTIEATTDDGASVGRRSIVALVTKR